MGKKKEGKGRAMARREFCDLHFTWHIELEFRCVTEVLLMYVLAVVRNAYAIVIWRVASVANIAGKTDKTFVVSRAYHTVKKKNVK